MKLITVLNIENDVYFLDAASPYYFRSDDEAMRYLQYLIDSDMAQDGTVITLTKMFVNDLFRVTAMNSESEWVHDAE